MKETTKITKTYLCSCGTQNTFTIDTDLLIEGLNAKVQCQHCGREMTLIFNGAYVKTLQSQQSELQPIQPVQFSSTETIEAKEVLDPALSLTSEVQQAEQMSSLSQSLSMFDSPTIKAASMQGMQQNSPTLQQTQAQTQQLYASSSIYPPTPANEVSEIVDSFQSSSQYSDVKGVDVKKDAIMEGGMAGIVTAMSPVSGENTITVEDTARKKAKSAFERAVECHEDALSDSSADSVEEYNDVIDEDEEKALRDLFGRL